MIHEANVAVPNAVILVMDRAVGEVPCSLNQSIVSATESCAAIGVRSGVDGDSRIALSDELPTQLRSKEPIFDGILATPTKTISVCSVYDEPLLMLDVPTSSTRIRVWVNHPIEPNEIWIVAGQV